VREAGWKLNQAAELFDMKNAPFEEISVPAGSKDEASVAARNRLSAVLVQLDPAAGFKAAGDGRSDKKQNKKGKDSGPVEKSNSTDANPAAKPDEDLAERGEKFDKLDKDKTGKLSRDYFISTQRDGASAAERFGKYDVDKDGFLSREEYVTRGGKSKPTGK